MNDHELSACYEELTMSMKICTDGIEILGGSLVGSRWNFKKRPQQKVYGIWFLCLLNVPLLKRILVFHCIKC